MFPRFSHLRPLQSTLGTPVPRLGWGRRVPHQLSGPTANACGKSPESQPGAFHFEGVAATLARGGLLGPKARGRIPKMLQLTMFGLTDIVTLRSRA
jgi:hypothetical protein